MKTRKLKIKFYKRNSKIALLYRNRVVFRGSYESARHFAIGFGSPIEREDVQAAADYRNSLAA